MLTASLVGQAGTLAFQIVLGIACLKSRVGRALEAAVPAPPPAGPAPPAAGA